MEELMREAICPICNGNMRIYQTDTNQGMDGFSKEWVICCPVCSIKKEYAADNFYGRRAYSKEEVIEDWVNLTRKE